MLKFAVAYLTTFFVTQPKRTRLLSSNWNAPQPVLRVNGRAVYTRGRPPWYTGEGQSDECFVIGICGGSGSGKTTVAQKIIERLNISWVSLLSMDSYYKVRRCITEHIYTAA